MTSRFGIGLYAPAGYVTSDAAIERAVARLTSLGHPVIIDETCRSRWQRFSATDDVRLAAVNRMASDPRVGLAMAARGGYGWSRLLDRIDYRTIAETRKRWIGHSDFTAFQMAALAHAGMTTFAGPMATSDFGTPTPSAFTFDHCWGLLGSDRYEVDCALGGPDFEGEGTIWGGNLAMITHLIGTPHMPRVDHGILFLEDVSEHPYRVERMLYQLHFAGILSRQRAVLFGVFNGYDLAENDNGYDAAAMVAHFRETQGVPLYTGLPFGHVPEKLTLPVGGHCALTVKGGRARLALSNYGPR